MKKRILAMLLIFVLILTAAFVAAAAEDTNIGKTVDNSDLVFAAGTTKAICPLCGSEEEWTPLSSGAAVKFPTGTHHYYLADDVTYTGTGADVFLTASTSSSAVTCLHLNGHNITATNARAIQGNPSQLNIMGSGTVSGSYTHATYTWRGSTVDINTSGANGAINLYGGTYVKAAGNTQKSVVSISNNGGRINLFDGAKVEAAEDEYGVFVSTQNSYTSTGVTPILTMYGGSITGGSVYFSGETVTATKGPAVFNLYGGTASGGIEVVGNTTVTVAAAPVVSGDGLKLGSGVVLNLGQLSGGADIKVDAREVFTDANGAANARYFKPAGEMDFITENADGTLSYFSNAPLSITKDGETAYCPVCKADATWTALGKGERVGTVSSGTKHYFLTASQDLKIAGPYMTLNASGTDTVQACLHTNGYALSYDGRSLVGNNATLNIMGTGSMSSDSSAATYGTGTLYIPNANAVINIYGSTITTTAAELPAINVIRAGKINMYGGIVDGNSVNRAVSMTAGEFTMHGGTIQKGKTTESGGNIYLSGATFTLRDGTVKGGKANGSGGNLLVDTDAVLNIHGGEILAGEAAGQGGNLRAYQATVNMSGGVISDGTGGSNADNVWLVDSVMDMSGGAVYGTEGAAAQAGSAIKINKYKELSTLTLSGSATVTGKNGQTQGNIGIFGTAASGNSGKVIVDKSWTGAASVAWGTYYDYGSTIPTEYGASTGEYTGKLIYEWNHMQPNIYPGADNTLVISGVRLYMADGTLTWPRDNAAAVANNIANPGSYIRVTVDGTTFQLPENESVTIDFNGKAANVTGSGTLRGMDSDNDAYAASSGAATVADTITVQTDVSGGENGYRYIAITENGVTTFHRLDMKITTVSLRPSAAGLYYKAAYSCDTALAGKVSGYGVVLSVYDMPGDDFRNVTSDRFTYRNSGFEVSQENGYTVNATSGSVFGIFKTAGEGRTDELNAQYGKMKIYANAYIMVDAQTDGNTDNDMTLVGDTANAGKQAGIAYSLFDALKAIDDNWESYASAQSKVKDFYDQWKHMGMDMWATELPNIVPMQPYLQILPANEGEDYSSFYVYLPAGDQYYAQYKFGYTKEPVNTALAFDQGPNDPANSDLYRLQGAYIGTLKGDAFTADFRALQGAEIGFAFREEGAGDFCGGYHGDEVLSAVSLTVDGEQIALNESLFRSFETLTFDQTSTIYRCNTPAQELALHGQSYSVAGDKIGLTQNIQWLTGTLPLQSAYAPMLTAQRLDPGNTERVLTDTVEFYAQPGGELVTTFDTSAYGSSSGSTFSEKVLQDVNAAAVKVYGKNSGFAAEAGYTVLDDSIPAAQQAASLVIRYASAWDSKVYFNIGNGAQPAEGEVWKSDVYYRLTYTPSEAEVS